ncbi:Beta-glucuronidase [Lachnellula suecica]|uniref:Beta-glucuronidase n=1 Tax=Lachnellula suecica TaxID=602035 RepID=A0A8T9BRQ4_9HELO|nr:Beta-glucuronidase [Lachnellula suecica]
MFSLSLKSILSLLPVLVQAATVSYTIPSSAPAAAAALDPAPVGVSFEFFAFPSYFKNVTATNQCLKNFQTLTGTWPPIRIGGTTQDRATYDAITPAYVVYTVAAPTDAPAALAFGPSFMTLANTYPGTVVVGLNRGHDNITNTIAAAKVASSQITNLLAIELGNEPEYYAGASQPVAVNAGSWTPAADAASQNKWDILVGTALGKTNVIQAGNSNDAPPTWGAAELIAMENATVKSYVHNYAHHNYPGGTLTSLMSHSSISSNIGIFKADIAAAVGVGKEYVLGETNSVSGGGAAAVSPTFGAALWTMDYVLRASLANIKRTYFHHGTVGLCYYCWWGRYNMGAPYYGAYTAVATMAGGSYISALDAGSTNYAAYVVYDAAKKPLKAMLYNSDYYSGSGTRGSQSFVLAGLPAGTVKAKRLTAANALSRVDTGGVPTFGGQTFANVTCTIGGTETLEATSVLLCIHSRQNPANGQFQGLKFGRYQTSRWRRVRSNLVDTGTNQHLQAHGGSIVYSAGLYYLIGENHFAGSAFQSINCYSSPDLVSWKFENELLSVGTSGDLGPNRVVERPHVMWNAGTSKWVMWMHIDSSSYAEAKAGVATSATICGKYTYM